MRCTVGFKNGEYATILIAGILNLPKKCFTFSLLWIEQLSNTKTIFLSVTYLWLKGLLSSQLRYLMNLSLQIEDLKPIKPSIWFWLKLMTKVKLKDCGGRIFHPFTPCVSSHTCWQSYGDAEFIQIHDFVSFICEPFNMLPSIRIFLVGICIDIFRAGFSKLLMTKWEYLCHYSVYSICWYALEVWKFLLKR